VTLKGVATVLRVLQEKLSVMPEGAASALKQIHSQVRKHCCREAPENLYKDQLPDRQLKV
jgi:hypothetical protein